MQFASVAATILPHLARVTSSSCVPSANIWRCTKRVTEREQSKVEPAATSTIYGFHFSRLSWNCFFCAQVLKSPPAIPHPTRRKPVTKPITQKTRSGDRGRMSVYPTASKLHVTGGEIPSSIPPFLGPPPAALSLRRRSSRCGSRRTRPLSPKASVSTVPATSRLKHGRPARLALESKITVQQVFFFLSCNLV